MHQPWVVAHVRVRQEDASQAGFALGGSDLIQLVELLPSEPLFRLWRRIVAGRIDESKARRKAPECWICPARVFFRARLRRASILRNPQHDEVGRSICRRRLLLASSRIPVQQMQKREREDYESVFLHSSKVILLEVQSARITL